MRFGGCRRGYRYGLRDAPNPFRGFHQGLVCSRVSEVGWDPVEAIS